jgi:hypothetical protein
MFEVNNGQIEIMDAADGFQRVAGIACEVAQASELQERFGDGIFQFTVVRQQNHNCCLHAQSFALRADLHFATIANCRAFLAGGFLLRLRRRFQKLRNCDKTKTAETATPNRFRCQMMQFIARLEAALTDADASASAREHADARLSPGLAWGRKLVQVNDQRDGMFSLEILVPD